MNRHISLIAAFLVSVLLVNGQDYKLSLWEENILNYNQTDESEIVTSTDILRIKLVQKPDPNLIEFYSNEFQVREDTPPTFIVHTADDSTVPVENSLRFYKALKDKNIPVEMHLYPAGGHGYSLGLGKAHLSSWTDRCIDWLKWVDGIR